MLHLLITDVCDVMSVVWCEHDVNLLTGDIPGIADARLSILAAFNRKM